jgi:hypothetical protein
MLLFQIPHRLVKLSGVSFPADATLHARLGPPELFGDAVLTGHLRVVPAGQRVELEADLFRGGIRVKPGGRFRTLNSSLPLFGQTIELSGTLATMTLQGIDQAGLLRAVEVLATHLGPLISQALRAPVEVAEVWGTAEGKALSVEVKGEFYRGIHAIDRESQLKNVFSTATAVDVAYPQRISSALRYLLQARRLDYAETFPAQFLGERLLNIYKAVEVLWGRKVDDLKKAMDAIGLNADFANVLASLVYLRDQVDIGHPAIQSLNDNEYAEVCLYAEDIEEIVTWLVGEVIARAAKDDTLPILSSSSTASGQSKDRARTIAKLSDARKKIHALHPTTFTKDDTKGNKP